MRRNYSRINFNNRAPKSYVFMNRHNQQFVEGGDLPRRPLRESPFSDLGLSLLGCILTYETIKQVERRIVA